MAVRIDRPGTRWWDYHTVGAGIGMTTAAGGVKTGPKGTLITRREYLADASFLVALQGDAALITGLSAALESPKWPVFLGRKSCPPSVPVLARPRADYKNTEYRKRRAARLEADSGLCVFCKNPGTTVQHITYRRAGGDEVQDDLRALCRLCHDAVTMIEYGHGMGIDRIDPCDVRWRNEILRTRGEILRHRSLETRRRHLTPDEVE